MHILRSALALLISGHKKDGAIGILFEGVIEEDGTGIPSEGYDNPLTAALE